jgi:hypothetical protein
LTISDVPTPFSVDKDNRIHALIPDGLPLGPAVVRLIPLAGDPIPPVLMQIDAPPPVILSALAPDGTPLDDSHFVTAGDVITLVVARLGNDASATVPASSVRVIVGGLQHAPTAVTSPDPDGNSQVQFALLSGLPDGSAQPVTVQVRTRLSAPYQITLAPAPPPPPPPSDSSSPQ